MFKMMEITPEEVKELSWVQCEDEACLKWRRIDREEVTSLENKSWFCHMNSDPKHNRCEDPEEDHRRTIQTANKCGYRYIFSQLPKGSLVWAKMTGHVRWPAILSEDPATGDYSVINNETGTPTEYHVEFLGQPQHSHCWVPSGNVDVYGSSCSYPKPQRSTKRGKKSVAMSAYILKKSEQYIKNLHASMDEAELIKSLSNEERWIKCVFRYKPKTEAAEHLNKPTEEQKEKRPTQQNDVVNPAVKKKRGRPPSKPKEIRESKTTGKSTHTKRPKTVSFPQHPEFLHKASHEPSLTSSDDDSTPQLVPELITTKEERLQADIKLLRKAEEKFEQRLHRFSQRHGIPVKNSRPNWQGRQVSPYQVYMAVQERGGYNMVCANRAWAQVYKDACGTSLGPHASVSSAVKTYYIRYLLPYELHELRSVDVDKTLRSSETDHRKHAKKHHKTKSKKHTKYPKQVAQMSKQAPSVTTNQKCLSNRPITMSCQHNRPIVGLERTCQPVIGQAAVTYQPVGGLYQPMTTKSQHWYPIADEEKSERAHIGSQGQPCLAPTPHGFQKDADGSSGGFIDVDYLQEESNQALIELKVMEEMLSSLDNQDGKNSTSAGHVKTSTGLDQPTHYDTQAYPSPLSSSKPVCLEFYSNPYDEEFMLINQSTSRGPPIDSSRQVPEISHFNNTESTNATSNCHRKQIAHGGEQSLLPQQDAAYSNILLDLDAVGHEIDRLNEELHEDFLDI
ncbi:histone-lysine N-methyltransferase NSD2-like [Asterias rubens]|uniref:histone-lysine N-methyltransferase NSD2-like n=1 Tax=Asterias rubens TaxID=7604 RepID=UPI00145599C1|nr:histone-lysine N-methyltransferase NSD2-like [Asterias rubens]